MSIAFTKDGRNYELGLDGTVQANGADFGTWTTNEDNALEITAKNGGAVFAHPARWSTKKNRLSVTPDGASAVEFLDATSGNIQFRINNNRLVIDPLPDNDEFSFSLSGDWSITEDSSALQLSTDKDKLVFTGGLNDSQSRFVWKFEAESETIKKIFSLRFDGNWKMSQRANGKGVLAVFAFEYTNRGQTTRDTFELPVEVSADAANGNRLLFSYKRAGSQTRWGVAFAGRFTTKGGSLIGYSAEMYDDNGKISSRFTFSFKGKVQNGSIATRNSLQFVVTIVGQEINLTLSGRYNFAKSSLSFSLQLNTSSKTGELSTVTFGLTFNNKVNGSNLDLLIKIDGSQITISLKIGADVLLGGSRKGSIYGKFDMNVKGDTVGIDALLGITLN